jgi:hypothetical protein
VEVEVIDLATDAPKAERILIALEGVEVRTDWDASRARDLLRTVKALQKAAEERRTAVTRPLNEALRSANTQARAVSDPLERAEEILKGKLAAFLKEREEGRERALAAAAAGDASALALTAPAAPLEGVNSREVWDFEVLDPDAVPRAFCSPDPKKIRAALSTDATRAPQVAGVRCFLRSRVSIRG